MIIRLTEIRTFALLFLAAFSLELCLTRQEDNYFCGDLNGDTLVLTVVLFRHGARTAISTYPTDPYQTDYWNQWGGLGQLTLTGREQHYLFGKWIRKCYNSFLPKTFNPNDTYVRSTDFDRTLQSALSHLAGAYPPDGSQNWTNDTMDKVWQPIPIHTAPLTDDYLLLDGSCPPYDALIADCVANCPEFVEIRKKNQDLLNYIAKNAGLPQPGDLAQIARAMCDSVYIERFLNLKLPDWMNETMVEKLDSWKHLGIIAKFANDEMVRYAGGEFVRNLLELLVNKTTGKVTHRHIVFSAHDTTVGMLLAVYGDFDRKIPPFRSAVITELHLNKTEGRYFVKTFYRNDTQSDPIPLQIRTCGNMYTSERCYLDEFVMVLQPFSLADKRSTCLGQRTQSTELSRGAVIAITFICSVIGTLVVSALIYFVLTKCFRKRVTLVESMDENYMSLST